MKLFLASSLDKTVDLLTAKWSKNPKETKVLFIANAADPYETDKFWIRWDREAFIKKGFVVNEIDLRQVTKEQLIDHMEDADILHVCGGSVLYLLNLIRSLDFETVIKDAVQEKGLFYSATSAGSMICAERVDLCTYDQEELDFVKGMTDFSGLSFVKFMIVPHANQGLFTEDRKRMVENMVKYSQALIFLQDSQAVWVEDDSLQILEVNS
jgi:peptidase E